MEIRRSTREQRAEFEAQSNLKSTMRELGWRCVRHTGSGKPNRFEKVIPGHHPFYVTSAPNNRWRLERDSGYSFRAGAFMIRKMYPVPTHRFETAVGMALWFDYVGQVLLRIPNYGN